MVKDLISIIVAVYNAGAYLTECLDSIINQTYPTLEIILVDDGSDDGSQEVCQDYEKKHSRIHLYAKENGGSASARNLGLSYAKGEYVIFVDADDRVSPEYIKRLHTAIKHSDIAICGFDRFEESGASEGKSLSCCGAVTREYVYEHTFASNLISSAAWNKLFRNKVIQENNLEFRHNIFKSEDMLFVAEYYSYCNSFYYIPECLYHYRRNPLSKTQEMYVKRRYSPQKNTMIDVGERIFCMNAGGTTEIRDICSYRLMRCCLWVMLQWIVTKGYDRPYADRMKRHSVQCVRTYAKFPYATGFQKFTAYGMSISPRLVWLTGRVIYRLTPSLLKPEK